MKKQLIYLLASAVFVTAGCTKESGEKGFGQINIACTADDDIEIAPESRAATVPVPDEFRLTIADGEGYNQSWETVAAFNAENLLIPEGSYTASVAWGDPSAEGPGKPYFTGSKTFPVAARKTSQVAITAQLANAQVAVKATKQFLAYFHDIEFSVETGSGNKFDFNLDAKDYVEVPVYVKVGTALSLTGTARRQSQTGTDNGLAVTFDKMEMDHLSAARTRHTFLLDASSAGSATLTITIGEEFTEVWELTYEMNDDAIL